MQINLSFSTFELQEFHIIDDNNTGIKSKDEVAIKEGLLQLMGLFKILINKYLPKLNLRLPNYDYFDYQVQIEY